MSQDNIYGLYDPRDPDAVMYVGKGQSARAEHHWKKFLSHGTAVNALLRRWFEDLKPAGVKAAWRVLEEVPVGGWEERERHWIAYWRVLNPRLCNLAAGGNAVPLDGTIIGGRNGNLEGKARGGRSQKSGHHARIGRLGGRRGSRNQPREAKVRAGRNGNREGKACGTVLGRRKRITVAPAHVAHLRASGLSLRTIGRQLGGSEGSV